MLKFTKNFKNDLLIKGLLGKFYKQKSQYAEKILGSYKNSLPILINMEFSAYMIRSL